LGKIFGSFLAGLDLATFAAATFSALPKADSSVLAVATSAGVGSSRRSCFLREKLRFLFLLAIKIREKAAAEMKTFVGTETSKVFAPCFHLTGRRSRKEDEKNVIDLFLHPNSINHSLVCHRDVVQSTPHPPQEQKDPGSNPARV
jgi:hypothetical protein